MALQVLAKTGGGGGRHGDWAVKLFSDPSHQKLYRLVYFWASLWTHLDKCPCGIPVNVAALEKCLVRHARLFFDRDNLNYEQNVGNYCRCP